MNVFERKRKINFLHGLLQRRSLDNGKTEMDASASYSPLKDT